MEYETEISSVKNEEISAFLNVLFDFYRKTEFKIVFYERSLTYFMINFLKQTWFSGFLFTL